MTSTIPVPQGEIAKRPLQFFWITDYSFSMTGRKIATLNQAIREALPEIKNAVETHPEVEIMMRAIKFSNTAEWHVGPEAVHINDFEWPELDVRGLTATAQAIRLLTDELTVEKMPRRGYPPVCILVSDGFCTDPAAQYNAAIAELEALPWGKKSVRLAIAIGDQREYSEKELLKFISHKEVGVLKADTPGKLVEYIKWASVTASVAASHGKTREGEGQSEETNVMLGPPPEEPEITDSTDIF